jgi:predicted nucleic acid-binding protein
VKQRIYIDTSIVGGYFDDEFQAETRKLFKRLEKGEILFVTSDLLSLELLDAPKRVRELLNKYPSHYFEKVEIMEEAIDLADQYIAENVVGKSSIEDCRHIALATISKVDVLASWNFRHIVNLQRIRGYNAINLLNGYSTLEIRSPKDLLTYED